MEEFKELPFVIRTQNAVVVCIILGFAGMILGIGLEIKEFVWWTGLFFAISLLCLIVASIFETRQDYSKKFIAYIEEKHKNCIVEEDYVKLHNEIISLATKDGKILLCYPTKINNILENICSSIRTIQKLNKNITRVL